MIYSVFDPRRKVYDYYEAPGSISPVAHMRPPKGSPHKRGQAFLPEALAVTVPVTAKKVGSGPNAQGLVARRSIGLDAFFPEESKPSFGWAFLLLAAGAGVGWYSARRFKTRG